jgi:hypothetical protein
MGTDRDGFAKHDGWPAPLPAAMVGPMAEALAHLLAGGQRLTWLIIKRPELVGVRSPYLVLVS